MAFIVLGTNHRYSPIQLRERLSLSAKGLKEALFFLKERGVLGGAVILSTCNRVEIYAIAQDPKVGIREIEEFISQYYEVERQIFSSYFYAYQAQEAIKHLFSVVCGLDSLILGETQILGQVRSSFFEAENAGFMDESLQRIFHRSFSLAKRMHRDTRICEGKVSVGSVAIDFIKERLGSLRSKNILIIGVGKVTELVLKHLKRENPNVVFISNRTFYKARKLAEQIGAKAVKFDRLGNYLPQADVIITATGSPHIIFKKEMLKEAVGSLSFVNRSRLLILDLALPRDVDPRVGEIDNVDLFGLEDLRTVIKKNIERKTQEADKVREIINTEIEKLSGLWPDSLIEEKLHASQSSKVLLKR